MHFANQQKAVVLWLVLIIQKTFEPVFQTISSSYD
uniref:Uncharacterized protein n=1 Tax=Anguilla anguilla TaxID=7936 RepID=A0A0E9TLY4_ANGAN